MEHGTTLLLGLSGVTVGRVEGCDDGTRMVHVDTADESASACPSCGVFSTSVKENVATRPRDLPYGEQPLELAWHKRRWRCREPLCERATFTESIAEVPRRARTTGRLRRACAVAVEENRCVDEVARSHRLSWPTVQRAVTARARDRLGEPALTTVLGIDETRFGRARWVRDDESATWSRTDPWQTGFVDLAGAGGLLGQVAGRTGACVTGWLDDRDQAWRDTVRVVAIDPSAPYRSAVRQALPDATIVVDHFHLVALANRMVTAVRQRITQQQLGRRGRKTDPAWVNRQLLLKASERLSSKALARMWNGCLDTDPTNQLLAAWIAKEELRAVLATGSTGGHRVDISRALWRFYTWCAEVDIPEVTALAETVEAWWPEIESFLKLGVTNAGTEGTNRLIKQVKRVACGFRNDQNYHDRVRLHCTRPTRRRATATIGTLPD